MEELNKLKKGKYWNGVIESWLTGYMSAIYNFNFDVSNDYYNHLDGYIWALYCTDCISEDTRDNLIYELIYMKDYLDKERRFKYEF